MKKIITLLLFSTSIFFNVNAQDFDWQIMMDRTPDYYPNQAMDAENNFYIFKTIDSDSIDINGTPYAVPFKQFAESFVQYALLKFNKQGKLIWARNIAIEANSSHGATIVNAYNDRIYLYLVYNTPNDYYAQYNLPVGPNKDTMYATSDTNNFGLMVCLDKNGYLNWAEYTKGHVYNMVVDEYTNSFYITDRYHPTGPFILKKYDSNGTLLYTKTEPVTGNNKPSYYNELTRIQTLNKSSNFIAVQTNTYDSTGQKGLIYKFDYNANKLDSFLLPASFKYTGTGPSIIDEQNNIYAIINYSGSGVYMGKTYKTYQLEDTTRQDMLIKLDSNLNHVWSIPVEYFYSPIRDIYYDKLSLAHDKKTLYLGMNGPGVIVDDIQGGGTLSHVIDIDDATGLVNGIIPFDTNYRDLYVIKAKNGIYFHAMAYKEVTIDGKKYTFNGTAWLDNLRDIRGRLKPSRNYIRGKVYYDMNDNGIQDAGERGAHLANIKVNGRNFYSTSNGNYGSLGEPGINIVTLDTPKYYTLKPNKYELKFNGYDSTITDIDFRFVPKGNFNDLEISINNVSFARPGFKVCYAINVKNIGTTTIKSAKVNLTYDNRLAFKQAYRAEDSLNGQKLSWLLDSITPAETVRFIAVFMLDSTANLGDSLLLLSNVTPIVNDLDSVNNHDSLYHTIRGAYDPNIKEVNKPEVINAAAFDNESFPLTYTIHFQNTGTDTAFNLFVIDSIDSDLNIATYELLYSSHSVEMNIDEENTIRWDFKNILLVDSNTNEPLSHGTITYRIWTKDTPKRGDEFTNFADIYFDFNEPVRTNTTVNRIDFLESVKVVKSITSLTVYPNPSNGVFTVKADIKAGTNVRVEVIDLTGKLVSTQTAVADAKGLETQVNINNLPQGIYFIRVYANNEIYTAKVVKE